MVIMPSWISPASDLLQGSAYLTCLYHAGRIWSRPAHNFTVAHPAISAQLTTRMLSWQEEASFITGVHLPVDGGLTTQLQDDFARKVLDHHAAASKL